MIHGDVLGERRRLTPDATALVDASNGDRWTYRELDDRAIRCARMWRDHFGLAKGTRVGLLSQNRPEYIEVFFAAPKAGVILVTLGTRLTVAELEHVLKDSGVELLLYDNDPEIVERVDALRDLFPNLTWVSLDELPELTEGLSADGFERTPCSPEDVYCLLYTSGTTGKPKGVMIPHRQVAWNGYNTACSWQLRADDISPIFTPLYHAGGLLAFLVPIFVIGGTVVLHRGFDPEEIWSTIERERCTVALGVPTIWKMLLESPAFENADLGSVRWLISGGAPLPEYLIEAYQQRGIVFMQGFGMTEVGVNCFAMTAEDSVRKKGSIGKPMMMTEVALVNEEGQSADVDEVGELRFRGPHVSLGYWNNPEATAASRVADDSGVGTDWFCSGDLARRDAEGYFYIAGRQKDMFISGGVNVYPAEIEAALVLHPAVEDVAVVGVPSEKWGEAGIAFVVPRPGVPTPEPEDLNDHLVKRLARYKIPKDYRFVESLPRTPYGKVVKGELRDSYQRS